VISLNEIKLVPKMKQRIFKSLAGAGRALGMSFSLIALAACVSNPAQDSSAAEEILESKGFPISEGLLEPYERYINADPLESRVYFRGSDYDDFLLGTSYRLITMIFEPGDKEVIAEFRSMEEDWIFSKYISVYIGTEKILDSTSGFSRRTDTSIVDGGSLGSTVYTHEIYSVSISLSDAKRIAFADRAELTVRFGGGAAGYVDRNPHPLANMKGPRAVVNLAEYFDSADTNNRSVGSTELPEEPELRELAAANAGAEEIRTKSEANENLPKSPLELELSNGSIVLLKPGMFRGYGSALKVVKLLPKMEVYHEEGLWMRLVEAVKEHNFGDDLAYYYLGLAAFELGYTSAASKYLDKSIQESKRPLIGKCITCNGIKLPADAKLLKARIDR